MNQEEWNLLGYLERIRAANTAPEESSADDDEVISEEQVERTLGVVKMLCQRDALLAFARDLLGDFMTIPEGVQEVAEKHGLIVCEPYDPSKHGEEHDDYYDPGDPFYTVNEEIMGKEAEQP